MSPEKKKEWEWKDVRKRWRNKRTKRKKKHIMISSDRLPAR